MAHQQLNIKHQLPATCNQATHPPFGGAGGAIGWGEHASSSFRAIACSDDCPVLDADPCSLELTFGPD